MISKKKLLTISIVVFIIIICIVLLIFRNFIIVNTDYKIFKETYDVYQLKGFKRFTPQKNDVHKGRMLAEKFLSNKKEIRNLSDYNTQYFGYIDQSGNKIVWANYICKNSPGIDWQHDLFIVLDGGNCFFNFKINLNTGIIYDYHVNGEG